ncbi:MAG TPA: hypothetical protein VF196_00385 [Casimicrobiaceae bacterium]
MTRIGEVRERDLNAIRLRRYAAGDLQALSDQAAGRLDGITLLVTSGSPAGR